MLLPILFNVKQVLTALMQRHRFTDQRFKECFWQFYQNLSQNEKKYYEILLEGSINKNHFYINFKKNNHKIF